MEKEIKVLISACLLGDNVKYSGGNNLTPELVTLLEKYNVKIVKICPECFAGLPIPRVPSEILGDKVFSKDGRDITEEFLSGAEKTYQKKEVLLVEAHMSMMEVFQERLFKDRALLQEN